MEYGEDGERATEKDTEMWLWLIQPYLNLFPVKQPIRNLLLKSRHWGNDTHSPGINLNQKVTFAEIGIYYSSLNSLNDMHVS